jgi:hypothetical protein
MYRYFYETNGKALVGMYGSLGAAIDAAMMDFSSARAKAVKIQDLQYRDLFDYHDLHWMYSRTWGAEYDRTTGTVIPRHEMTNAQ